MRGAKALFAVVLFLCWGPPESCTRCTRACGTAPFHLCPVGAQFTRVDMTVGMMVKMHYCRFQGVCTVPLGFWNWPRSYQCPLHSDPLPRTLTSIRCWKCVCCFIGWATSKCSVSLFGFWVGSHFSPSLLGWTPGGFYWNLDKLLMICFEMALPLKLENRVPVCSQNCSFHNVGSSPQVGLGYRKWSSNQLFAQLVERHTPKNFWSSLTEWKSNPIGMLTEVVAALEQNFYQKSPCSAKCSLCSSQ